MIDRKNIGEQVRRMREQRGLSMRELAKRAGITHSQLGLVERGTSNTTLETLGWILTALGADLRIFAVKPLATRRQHTPLWTLPANQ